MAEKEPKVTGVGGIFFKTEDPEAARQWYADHLHFPVDKWGCSFQFRDKEEPERVGILQWTPFPDNTQYFNPSKQPFMVNYRVQNLEGLMQQLKDQGVTIIDEIASYDYGKFLHIMDPFGNAIELWEPVDDVEPLK